MSRIEGIKFNYSFAVTLIEDMIFPATGKGKFTQREGAFSLDI